MHIKEKIDAWVEAHSEDFVRDVSRLVAIDSTRGEAAPGAPFGQGPAAALQEMLALCREKGFAVTDYDGYVGTADLAPGAPPMLDILGHLDVVGAGDGWETDPFTAVFKDDGCLYGRGTDDDKGPVVAALYAMACVRDLGLAPRYNCRLIFGTDEESGSSDIAYYYAREASAPNTFSPDAQFPVYNTEKGQYRVRFTRKWAKSTALPRLCALHGGFRINVLPGEASATIAGLRRGDAEEICARAAARCDVSFTLEETASGLVLSVKGQDAHASTPEAGVNGITAILAILCELPLSPDDPASAAVRALHALFPHGDGAGAALGIAQEDALSGPLTVAFSLLELDETGLEGHFDSRVPLCATEENCRRRADGALEQAGFTVESSMSAPHHTPADTPFIASLLESYTAYTGREGACLAMGGGTYVHDVPGGVAFGAGMPGFVSNLHGANERVCLRDILTAVKIFAAVIARMCCGVDGEDFA